ncbi:MAG: glycosyltransferase [Parachlamydiaceae bacterium]
MIVKNEKDVITACLKSVLPVIDTWLIVDTGSTDGTQQVIKDFFKDIPGELHERPWVNFGYNRQEALELAKHKADYLLFMDADDQLAFDKDFKMPPLTKDFYVIASRRENEEEFWIHRLIRANLGWHWEGAIHEDLYCHDYVEGTQLPGVLYLYMHHGDRAKNPDTWKKDVDILLDAIKKDPNNPRNYFYLARSYQNGADLPRSLEYYQKRADMKIGNPEEIFLSMLSLAKIQSMLKMDQKTVEQSLVNAYLFRPHRIEPLYYLANGYRVQGKYQKAYEIASYANGLPKNPNEFLAIEKWIYDYGLLFELAFGANHTGHYSEGVKICSGLLTLKDIPDSHRKEIETLYNTLLQRNVEDIKEKVLSILSK